MCAKLIESCPTLRDIMDCNLPVSSVHGILQARTLEWVAMLSSRGSSQLGIKPLSPAMYTDSLPPSHQGSPYISNTFEISPQ